MTLIIFICLFVYILFIFIFYLFLLFSNLYFLTFYTENETYWNSNFDSLELRLLLCFCFWLALSDRWHVVASNFCHMYQRCIKFENYYCLFFASNFWTIYIFICFSYVTENDLKKKRSKRLNNHLYNFSFSYIIYDFYHEQRWTTALKSKAVAG